MSGAPTTLHSIWIAEAAGAPMRAVGSVRALEGVGLAGDRYAARSGTFSNTRSMSVRDLSLVALETVEDLRETFGIELEPGALRRNLVTRGLDLAALVGATLGIGEVRLEVTSTCPPCAHLDRLLGFEARPALRRRGGLRARVAAGGPLVAGMPVEVLVPPPVLP